MHDEMLSFRLAARILTNYKFNNIAQWRLSGFSSRLNLALPSAYYPWSFIICVDVALQLMPPKKSQEMSVFYTTEKIEKQSLKTP